MNGTTQTFDPGDQAIVGPNFSLDGWRGRVVRLERLANGSDSSWLCYDADEETSQVYIDQSDLLPEMSDASPQSPLVNPVSQVYFRAGLIACREYMARFVEAESPTIAASIRANWWPTLGPDFGPPRQMEFGELTEGEFGEPGFRCKGRGEISPTLEALAVAWVFLNHR